MTPRPPTHREPTDEEMQCLPEGTLVLEKETSLWVPSELIGEAQLLSAKHLYAVPITKQEEAQEPRKTLRDEFAMAALSGMDLLRLAVDAALIDRSPEIFQMASKNAYLYADAMLAARNQTA